MYQMYACKYDGNIDDYVVELQSMKNPAHRIILYLSDMANKVERGEMHVRECYVSVKNVTVKKFPEISVEDFVKNKNSETADLAAAFTQFVVDRKKSNRVPGVLY